jgi:hypothetical protein
MRKLWVILVVLFSSIGVNAQYDYDIYDRNSADERFFYDEDFDWRWDVRVRISNGINNGLLTRREANRLYNRLESIERREFAYQSDGYYSPFEQDDIWNEVVRLNRLVGLELRDFDRNYYGFNNVGVGFYGYLPWYGGRTYDFYRFDRRGFGSVRIGYAPRFYAPSNHFYHRNYTYFYGNNNRNSNNNRNNSWNNSRNNNWNNNNRNDRSTPSRSTPRNNNWNNDNRNDRSTPNRSNNPRGYENNNRGAASGSSEGRIGRNERSNPNIGSKPEIMTPRSSSPTRPATRPPSGVGSDRGSRGEISTPRSSNSGKSNANTQRSTGRSLPDRGKANDGDRNNRVQ